MLSRWITGRFVLLFSLGAAWINFLFTTKWAHLPGALNGWKRPWYAAVLLIVTALAIGSRRIGRRVSLPALPVVMAGGWLHLLAVFFIALPLSNWSRIPFFDDWPPRFQSTLDGITLLSRGAVTGWNWNLLGGYQTSSDVNQPLMIGAIPMLIFGGPVGYHLLHLLMFVAIPLVLYFDLAEDEPRDVARLAGFFAVVFVTGFSGSVVQSGDTNSMAGVLCAVIALSGSRNAQRGRRWGGPLMAAGLTLALYTHAAFFLYASAYLVLESVYYRDRRLVIRYAVAAATACIAALPLYWELIRYPAYFLTNNIFYTKPAIVWTTVAHKIYYNFEMLLFPHRWFNDFLSLTNVTLTIVACVAVKARSRRAGFYAWCALLTIVLSGLDVPEFGGYLFARVIHMLAVLTPVVLAWFIVEQAGNRTLAWGLVALVALYQQTNLTQIPHVSNVQDFNPELMDRLRTLDGPLVLLEGNPHRDLISDPNERTERTPFGTHFESMIAQATGRRYYAQTWDGFHWTPFRGQTVAGGSFRGRRLDDTAPADFVAEMRKWGVRHLVVWSKATKAYLDAAPAQFERGWSAGLWVDYQMREPDVRDVVLDTGSGRLRDLDLLGGRVSLDSVRAGETAVIRMNYFPAWTARVGSRVVPLRSVDGQLAFETPADGDYDVILEYPRRTGLMLLSLASLLAGGIVLAGRGSPWRG